jgi:hypothetical protein
VRETTKPAVCPVARATVARADQVLPVEIRHGAAAGIAEIPRPQFPDRLEQGANTIARTVADKAQADATFAARFDCPPERRFVGEQAFRDVIGGDVDLVLTDPPYSHQHMDGGGFASAWSTRRSSSDQLMAPCVRSHKMPNTPR